MSDLNPKEQDLLDRVHENPDLRPIFFQKVKGLRWFVPLRERGYFNADRLPRPVPAKEEGYVTIQRWDIAGYLAKTAPELSTPEGAALVPAILDVIVAATNFARAHGFGNYQTWWKFSEVVSQIPAALVPIEFAGVVDSWLDDPYDRSLVSDHVGRKWIPDLLATGSDHSLELALSLLDSLYRVIAGTTDPGQGDKKTIRLRMDSYRAERISETVAQLSGRRIGLRATKLFHSKLEEALTQLSNDRWSALWQPAIEDHPQNEHRHDPENILVEAYRDCLSGHVGAFPDEAAAYIGNLLSSNFQTIQRVAIHCITEHFASCSLYADRLLVERFFHSFYQHEQWQFLNKRYGALRAGDKERVREIISTLRRTGDNGESLPAATAYYQSIWLSAIKDFGDLEAELYKATTRISGAEPEHPDFSAYMSSGFVSPKSPFSIEELGSLAPDQLVAKIGTFRGDTGWDKPSSEGLSATLRQLLKTSPAKYYPELLKFREMQITYLNSVVAAFSELWAEKTSLPWADIWPRLIELCATVIQRPDFWTEDPTPNARHTRDGRASFICSIGRLLQSGTASDEHAFDEALEASAERLVSEILEHQPGNRFDEDSDAVFVAINSPRGTCIEALLNLALRACRLADRTNERNHEGAWRGYQDRFDVELERSLRGEYEFATLVAMYLPNFLYMSKDWTLSRLDKIFSKENELHWLCASQGYSYVNAVHLEIYAFLKEQGHLVRMLDNPHLKKKVVEKVIQNIAVAYLSNYERLEDPNGAINTVLARADSEELHQLVWFLWTLRKKEDKNLQEKVLELWPKILSAIDLTTSAGKKLASTLSYWSVFIENLDTPSAELLSAIAPFVDHAHNSSIYLESLAKLSGAQPLEANDLWLKVLRGSAPTCPEEAIRGILRNLVAQGEEGKRRARETVSEYLRRGIEMPSIALKELSN